MLNSLSSLNLTNAEAKDILLQMHNKQSILLNTDSYKVSMHKQYPEGTQYVYSYVASRGGKYDAVMHVGTSDFVKNVLLQPFTLQEIQVADEYWRKQGLEFPKQQWIDLYNKYSGYLPVEVYAVPEGTVVPVKNAVAAIVNTDPDFWWITTWLETSFLRSIWYPSTVATNGFEIKKIIKSYLDKSGDVSGLAYKLHDFGARGVSSYQSAAIGGAAHLINFYGTDTAQANMHIESLYETEEFNPVGTSIFATEHSTITSWGQPNELQAYKRMLELNKGGIFACVSDSYNIYEACKLWGSLANEIISSGTTLVVRPDSGDPVVVIRKCFEILAEYFGTTLNSKGYKVLNNVRIIWGDGINENTIQSILRVVVDLDGFSADNVAFGMGGALLQLVGRDDQKFAMKCSAACVNGEWRDVFKDPITDSGKSSLKGIVSLYKDSTGAFCTKRVEDATDTDLHQLKIAYQLTGTELGININAAFQNFAEVRKIAESYL